MTKQYRDSKTVLTYLATAEEIETKDIIFAAFANKKKVAVPVTNEDFSLSFYYIEDISQLKVGSFNILEPIDRTAKVTDFSDSICITPSLCCDYSGYRLGYGKGCYDRFFSHYTGTKISLCYSDFVTLSLEKEPCDIPVDILVCDSFVRQIK